MTIESTLPSPTAYAPTAFASTSLADQRKALAALDRIIELHPNLPAAYITLSEVYPERVTVQSASWSALEAWRVALGVAPADVELGNCEPVRPHLEFEAAVDGAQVRVYMLGDPVEQPADAAPAAVSL